MTECFVPCYFFPTTVVFVDDNQSILNSINLGLEDRLLRKIFLDPKQTIEFLQDNQKNRLTIDQSIFASSGNLSGAASQGVELDLLPLQEFVYQPRRFDEVSIVVVDYAMPTMNGLELCTRLKEAGVNCKKLMLTGEADHSTAVAAFNKNIIDKFVLKNEISTDFDVLNTTIHELQKQYFSEKSEKIMQHLLLDPLAPFKNASFLSLFESICREYDIVEYYAFDTSGSFILFTAEGKPIWFIVKNKEDHEMYCHFAEDAEVDSQLYESLKEGKMIPFYPDGAFNLPNDSEWSKNCLIPAQQLKCGEDVLYYGLTELPVTETIKRDQIQPFAQYLSSLGR